MDVTKPYEFIGFGAMDVTKPYEIYKVWGHGCHQTLYIYICIYIYRDRHRRVAGGRALAKPYKSMGFGALAVWVGAEDPAALKAKILLGLRTEKYIIILLSLLGF